MWDPRFCTPCGSADQQEHGEGDRNDYMCEFCPIGGVQKSLGVEDWLIRHESVATGRHWRPLFTVVFEPEGEAFSNPADLM